MKIRWIRNLLKAKKSNFSKGLNEKSISALIDFLWKKVDVASNTSNLENKIRAFSLLPPTEQIVSLPEIYLILEEFITEKNIKLKYTKQEIRSEILKEHEIINAHKNIRLIFRPLKEQELLLCEVFLNQVLNKYSELAGSYEDSSLIQISQSLNISNNSQTIDLVRERKRLLEFSNQIFAKIRNSLGENVITNIYLTIYKEHFQSYHLLESFTATLNVIPEEILSKDLINFPSKQQMHKMLQKQLYSMEEMNDKLAKEIIERKKIEEELKHSEHLKTTILETAMDGIILVDCQGVVLNWNTQAENILEIKKSETIGRNISEIVPFHLSQEIKISINNYIKTGNDKLINKRVETLVTKKDGSTSYIELTIIAIKTKTEHLFNAFFRDITDKKIIDNEIREAKVMAEKSTEEKSNFLSNLSHEIRTPLNVILGLTDILKKSNFSNPQVDKNNIDGIGFSAENLLSLINDILDFSKIEAGKLTIDKTDFNIHELIKNISRGFKIKADEKSLRYKVHIEESLPKYVIGDPFRLNQILTNLLGNAIKFTFKGEISIHVSVEKTDSENVTINFSVQDTGMGIQKDQLENVFENFYQVNEPRKHRIEGTGLGLSICKQLVELQNGTLTVKSELGTGSVFQFSIPYSKSNTTSLETENNDTSEQNIAKIDGMKILVVEDNKMNQFFMKQLCANWNIHVDMAENGKVAIERLEQNTYDLVLMDMHMPVMDGPKATKHIRKSKNPKIQKIPIIACSADVFPESKKEALDSGMNFYLTKPIKEKALLDVLVKMKPSRTEKTPPQKKPKINIATDSVVPEKYLNLGSIKKLFNNDYQIIQSILQIFLEETPKDYQQLKIAIANNNSNLIHAFSHKLKFSFKTIGLDNEASILEKMERNAKENKDFDEIIKLSEKLDDSYPSLMKEIQIYTKELIILNT